MRIGVVGPVGPDTFADNIVTTLADMGNESVPLGTLSTHRGRYGSAIGRIRDVLPVLEERAQRHIATAALKAECEIIINVDQRLTPDIVYRLRRSGIKVAMWFPDAIVNMRRQLILLARYDAIFFKEPHLVDKVGAFLDLPVFYLPQACNPRWHYPLVTAGTEPYLVIAGNMYPSRVLLLERLIANGIPLKLYGSGFPRWLRETPLRAVHTGRHVVQTEKARIFRSATAVINTMHPGEISGVNLRLFEAAGCGAAVLTEFRPTVPELFSIGDEVLAFHGFDELVEQAKRLLNDRGLSAKFGDAAAIRAHESHTYQHRLTKILEKLC